MGRALGPGVTVGAVSQMGYVWGTKALGAGVLSHAFLPSGSTSPTQGFPSAGAASSLFKRCPIHTVSEPSVAWKH